MIWKLIAPLDLHMLLNTAMLTKEIQGLVGIVWLIDGRSSLGQFTARCQIIEGFVGDGGFRGSEFGRGLISQSSGSVLLNTIVFSFQLIKGLFWVNQLCPNTIG